MVYGGVWTGGGKEGEKKEPWVREEGREKGAAVGEEVRGKKLAAQVAFHNPHHLVIVDLNSWLLLNLYLRCTQGA